MIAMRLPTHINSILKGDYDGPSATDRPMTALLHSKVGCVLFAYYAMLFGLRDGVTVFDLRDRVIEIAQILDTRRELWTPVLRNA